MQCKPADSAESGSTAPLRQQPRSGAPQRHKADSAAPQWRKAVCNADVHHYWAVSQPGHARLSISVSDIVIILTYHRESFYDDRLQTRQAQSTAARTLLERKRIRQCAARRRGNQQFLQQQPYPRSTSGRRSATRLEHAMPRGSKAPQRNQQNGQKAALGTGG